MNRLMYGTGPTLTPWWLTGEGTMTPQHDGHNDTQLPIFIGNRHTVRDHRSSICCIYSLLEQIQTP